MTARPQGLAVAALGFAAVGGGVGLRVDQVSPSGPARLMEMFER